MRLSKNLVEYMDKQITEIKFLRSAQKKAGGRRGKKEGEGKRVKILHRKAGKNRSREYQSVRQTMTDMEKVLGRRLQPRNIMKSTKRFESSFKCEEWYRQIEVEKKNMNRYRYIIKRKWCIEMVRRDM